MQALAVDWRFSTPALYVGTARGVYRSIDGGSSWSTFENGMPNVMVEDLQLIPQLNLLAAGTYGRGVWEIQALAQPTVQSASFTSPLSQQKVAFTFDENVGASIDPGDLQLMNLTTGTQIPLANIQAAYDSNTNTATFTFTYINGVLPNGSYAATLLHSGVFDQQTNHPASDTVYRFIWASGNASSNAFTVSSGGGTVNVYLNSATPTYTASAATLDAIALAGGNSADSFTVDLTGGNPIPPDGLTVDGGAATDSLVILGTAGADNATFTSNSITLGNTITYSTLEAVRFDGHGGSDNVTVSSGAVQFPTSQHLASLTIADGATAVMETDGNNTLYVNTLSIGASGKLDVNDNDLVVNNGDFSTIQNLVFAGYRDHVDTAATGIVSSTSQATGGKTILALFDNALVGRTDWPAGSGQAISSTAVVGKYTYYGDVNLDGQVTGDDYSPVDSNLGATGLNPGNAWLMGDTNGDLSVTGDDYSAIDANLGLGVGNPLATPAAAVPAVVASNPDPVILQSAAQATTFASPFSLTEVIDGSSRKEDGSLRGAGGLMRAHG